MINRRSSERGRSRGPSSYPTRNAQRARSVGAVLVVLVLVPPLVLLVVGSLHPPGLPPPPALDLVPDAISLEPYVQALELGGLARATLNSSLVAVIAVPLSVLVASFAGFALTQLPRRATRLVVGLSLVALTVPVTALLVPRFTIFRALGLTDTLLPLVAPALIGTSPLYVLVFFLAFRALPADLYDACRLEDLSPLQTWRKVAMPLVRPVTAGVATLTFILTWSSFLEPLVILYDRDRFTLPLALRSLSTLDPSNFPVLLAGAVIATVPALIVFGLAQRRFLHQDIDIGRTAR